MRLRAVATFALWTAAATLLVSCSSGRAGDGEPVAAGAPGTERVPVARSVQLRRGERATVVRVADVARIVAACSRRGRPLVSLVADHALATAAVTVQTSSSGTVRRTLDPGERFEAPTPRGRSDVQTWQIAEFAKVESVTTIWVALGRSPGAPFYTCGVSAHAITTPE